MKKPYSLLVFDWDGTLMDSQARIVACLQGAIAQIGAPPRTTAQLRDIIGLGLTEAVQRLYPDADERFVQAMAQGYREHYFDPALAPCALFEGAREVIELLSEQGYLLAVATGKGRHGLDKALQDSGLAAFFHMTRCADETFSKPHPLMLEQIMTDLDTPAEHTLMIGDTEYDMQLAHNAGTEALAVTYGVHTLERLLAQSPAGHIHRIAELQSWLERQADERSVA